MHEYQMKREESLYNFMKKGKNKDSVKAIDDAEKEI